MYDKFDREKYLEGKIAPVFFGSALNNFGVQELLDSFIDISPFLKEDPQKEPLNQMKINLADLYLRFMLILIQSIEIELLFENCFREV